MDNEMKHILGLDLGTNSIGWAIINALETERGLQPVSIEKAGSRDIPMDSKMLSNFGTGQSISTTKERTKARGMRRLIDRRQLRRERLNRVLQILGFLPTHYASHLNRYGQIEKGYEPKIAWSEDRKFLFEDSFNEMCEEFKTLRPELFEKDKKIAYDWTVYYLRKKALTKSITKQEFAWILHQFNSKRGYNQSRSEVQEYNDLQKKTIESLKILNVEETSTKRKGLMTYRLHLENGLIYEKSSRTKLEWEGQTRDFIITTIYDEKTKAIKSQNVSLPDPTKDEWELKKVRTESDLKAQGGTVGEYIYDLLLNHHDEKVIGEKVRVIDRKFYKEELRKIIETQISFIPELQNEELLNDAIEALYPSNESHRNTIKTKGWIHLLMEDILFYQRPLKSKKHLIASCPFEEHAFLDDNRNAKTAPIHVIPQSHPLFEEFRVWGYIHNLCILEKKTSKDVTADFLGTPEKRADLFEKMYASSSIKQERLLGLIGIKKDDLPKYRWNYEEDLEMKCAPICYDLRSRLKKAGVSIGEFAKSMQNFRIENKKNRRWGDVCFNQEQDLLLHLWHLCYSISNQEEFVKALNTWVKRYDLGEGFVKAFANLKPFASAYGAFSERTISRMLPLMREGKFWSADKIDPSGVVTKRNNAKKGKFVTPESLNPTRERIEKIITGEFDENIDNQVRQQLEGYDTIEHYQGLPDRLASYVIYNRFSEAKSIVKWTSPDDIDNYLEGFRHHSLNNPVVEQVLLETLRMVRDIWKEYGTIDEIHIEMARDMKKNAKERQKISQRNKKNEETRKRIIDLLNEMSHDSKIESVIPYSPSQQEKLRIVEEQVLATENKEDPKYLEMTNLWKSRQKPSESDIKRYRLWLDQKYRSPYTGQPIPFSKLFTSAYQIEHIIPQSKYFDDSLDNKVICEAEVNSDKDNELAMNYINASKGKEIILECGKIVHILMPDTYISNIEKDYCHNLRKQQNLLRTEVPHKFSERQKNDTRYITRLVMLLLSNIVREVDENTRRIEPEAKSKNVVVTNGTITTRLKHDWGINDAWNNLIMPRFRRMNEMLNTDAFVSKNREGHDIPTIPTTDIDKKRIDHRHHAMDAIVIACTTQNHVNLMNNMTANDNGNVSRHDLQVLLREQEEWITSNGEKRKKFVAFKKPWPTIMVDTERTLTETLTSFKQNLRVIKTGKKQKTGTSWGICRSLHKDTGYGLVNLQGKTTVKLAVALTQIDRIVNKDLREKLRQFVSNGKSLKEITAYFEKEKEVWSDVDIKKIPVYMYSNETKNRYVATRSGNDLVSLFKDCVEQYAKKLEEKKEKDLETIREKTTKVIESITDLGIQTILKNHLHANNEDVSLAFSADGIDRMNANIQMLTTRKRPHKPIKKVRIYSDLGEKFMVSAENKKYVVTDKDTNLYCGVFQKENGSRMFHILNLREAMRLQMKAKEEKRSWLELYREEKMQEEQMQECRYLFMLSPGDIVYLPITDKQGNENRIYFIVNNFTGSDFYFRPLNHAEAIYEKEVDIRRDEVKGKLIGSFADKTTVFNGISIKENCVLVHINRLGTIINP